MGVTRRIIIVILAIVALVAGLVGGCLSLPDTQEQPATQCFAQSLVTGDLWSLKGNSSNWQLLTTTWTEYAFLPGISLPEGEYLVTLTPALRVRGGPEIARGGLFVLDPVEETEWQLGGDVLLSADELLETGEEIFATPTQWWILVVPEDACHYLEFRFKQDSSTGGDGYVHKGEFTGWWILKLNAAKGAAPPCR